MRTSRVTTEAHAALQTLGMRRTSDLLQREGQQHNTSNTTRALSDLLKRGPPFSSMDPESLVLVGMSARDVIEQILGFVQEERERDTEWPLGERDCWAVLSTWLELFAAWDAVYTASDKWRSRSCVFPMTKEKSWFYRTPYEDTVEWLFRVRDMFAHQSALRRGRAQTAAPTKKKSPEASPPPPPPPQAVKKKPATTTGAATG